MDQTISDETIARTIEGGQDKVAAMTERLTQMARSNAVFGDPVTNGDTTVITASEVFAAMGMGFGTGGGTAPEQPGSDGHASATAGGSGGGGGGGGTATARPIATITIRPSGVDVVPILDVTKLGLAAMSMLTGIGVMWARAWKARK